MKDKVYEAAVNQFIPQAKKYADEKALHTYGEEARRVVHRNNSAIGDELVSKAKMSMQDKRQYEAILAYWNACFHNKMNKLTIKAGIRKINFKEKIRRIDA